MSNREIEARLKISAIDRTGKIIERIGQRLETVGKKADMMNKRMSMFSKLGGITAGYFAVDRIASGIKDAVVDFAAVERQMNRIGITAGATKEETTAAFAEIQKQAKGMSLPLDAAIKGLDTLVASGMSLKEAMAFLPAVLATTQASGADAEDIANTIMKASSALKLSAGEAQKAFDIMVEGGKAGQFELKDMATYIPNLANSFSSLGYTGTDGLKRLVALMQTVREDTGTAEEAATDLRNIFDKIYTADTATKFKKMGVDLNAELAKARKNGEDTVAAFVRISREALKGDLNKLPLLFTDAQFKAGMQSLITSQESYEKFLKTVNDSKVDGSVFRDLNRVMGDTQSKIDQLDTSWTALRLKLGEKVADVAAPAMQNLVKGIDDMEARNLGQEKLGWSSNRDLYWNSLNDFLDRYQREMPGVKGDDLNKIQGPALAALGRGEVNNLNEFLDRELLRVDAKGLLRKNYGLYRPGKGPENPLGASPSIYSVDNPPIPVARPDMARERLADAYRQGGDLGRPAIPDAIERMKRTEYGGAQQLDAFYGETGDLAAIKAHMARKKRVLGGDTGGDAGADQLAASLDAGGQKIKDGGDAASKAISSGAQEFQRIISAAAVQFAAAVANIKVNVGAAALPRANADTGPTNRFVISPASRDRQ